MIPEELKRRKQWICWKYENHPGRAKPTKVPYNPLTGYRASSVDASTWTDYETAKSQMGRYSGIGFVFTKEDPYVGIDLDHVLDDKGQFIQQDAKEIFEKCSSYTEISPSGTGIHIIGKAKLHDVAHKVEENIGQGTCEKELYESGRYFTVTGNQLGQMNEVKDLQSVTDELEQVMAKVQKGKRKSSSQTLSLPSRVSVSPSAVNAMQEDPVVTYARQVFPNINTTTDAEKEALHDRAVKIQRFLNDGAIVNAVKDKELFITYTQENQTRTVIIPDEGMGFRIPQDPTEQKEYLYAKLFRYLDKTGSWEIENQPHESTLSEATRTLISDMKDVPGGKDSKQFFDRQNFEKTISEQQPTQIWNDILADMARYPQLSKTMTFFASGEKKGLLISKEIIGLFKTGVKRELEKEPPKEIKPTLTNRCITAAGPATTAFLEKDHIVCQDIPSEELGKYQYRGCLFNKMEFSGTLEKTVFNGCYFGDISIKENTKFKDVIFNACKFDSLNDALLMQEAGAKLNVDCVGYDKSQNKFCQPATMKEEKVKESVKAVTPRSHSERMER